MWSHTRRPVVTCQFKNTHNGEDSLWHDLLLTFNASSQPHQIIFLRRAERLRSRTALFAFHSESSAYFFFAFFFNHYFFSLMRKVGQTHFLFAFLLSPGRSWELLNQRLIEVNRHGGAFVMGNYTFRWRHSFTHLFLAHKKLDRLALTHEYKCTRRSKDTVKGPSLLSTSAEFCAATSRKDGKHPEKADLIKIFHPAGMEAACRSMRGTP